MARFSNPVLLALIVALIGGSVASVGFAAAFGDDSAVIEGSARLAGCMRFPTAGC